LVGVVGCGLRNGAFIIIIEHPRHSSIFNARIEVVVESRASRVNGSLTEEYQARQACIRYLAMYQARISSIAGASFQHELSIRGCWGLQNDEIHCSRNTTTLKCMCLRAFRLLVLCRCVRQCAAVQYLSGSRTIISTPSSSIYIFHQAVPQLSPQTVPQFSSQPSSSSWNQFPT
jgi:hypothetical protein